MPSRSRATAAHPALAAVRKEGHAKTTVSSAPAPSVPA